MNATTPVSSTEHSRITLQRGPIPFSWNATNRPPSTGLFEQLLNFSAPPAREPSSPAAPPRPESSSEKLGQESHDDIAAPQARDASSREDDEESPSAAAEAAAAQAAVQPATAPELPEDSNEETSKLAQATGALADAQAEAEASPAEASSIANAADENGIAEVEKAATREDRPELASQTAASGDAKLAEVGDKLALDAEAASDKADAGLPTADEEVTAKDALTLQPVTESQATAENVQSTNEQQHVDENLTVQAPTDGEQRQPDDDARRDQRSARGQRSKWYERDAQESVRGSYASQDKPYIEKEPKIALDSDLGASPGHQSARAEQTGSADASDSIESMTAITEPMLGSPAPLASGIVSQAQPPQATAVPSIVHADGDVAGPNSTSSASHHHDATGSPAAGSEHRSTSAANRANGEPQSSGVSQQEQVRLIQRVARSFNRLGPMGGEVNLRLHPPELGSLNVQVRLEGRSLTAKLTTENGAAREVILENLPVLKSRLAEQGVEVALFQVDVAENGNADAGLGNGSQQAYEQQQQGERQPTQYHPPVHRFVGNAARSDSVADEQSNHVWLNASSRGIDVHA